MVGKCKFHFWLGQVFAIILLYTKLYISDFFCKYRSYKLKNLIVTAKGCLDPKNRSYKLEFFIVTGKNLNRSEKPLYKEKLLPIYEIIFYDFI